MDCCRTHELFGVLYARLVRDGMMEFYLRHYYLMYEALLDTMLGGMRVDRKAQKQWRKRLEKECDGLRKELKEGAGEDLWAVERKSYYREPTKEEWRELLGDDEDVEVPPKEIPKPKEIDAEARKRLGYIMTKGVIRDYTTVDKKGFSTKKLMNFFYGKLGLPKQTKIVKRKGGKTRADTLDEAALRKMTVRYPGKIGEWGMKLLAHREKKREMDYLKGAWDKDGRIRCSYKMLTESGRLSSAKNPKGTGYNLQNVKR
jgi:hypothetical protein